jgi:hypothetical protein
MKHKYKLSDELIHKASYFHEFANGAAQATVLLKDGSRFNKALISNSTALIAIHGYKDLPFNVQDISDIFQSIEDINPKETGGW